MKPLLKIYFSDFWGSFDYNDNFFIDVLSKYYRVEVSEKPDILIYSCHGINFLNYNCHRIFYTGENVRPDLNECDLALSFDYLVYGGKNIRLPFYVGFWGCDIKKLLQPKDPDKIIREKRKFCSLVLSNHRCKERNLFFKKLNRRKRVNSGGKLFNNVGYQVADKVAFLAEHKFDIAFENSSYPGYTTEKIYEAMVVGAIPIYWGNPDVITDFNTKSFINVHDFYNFDEVIEHVLEVDQNEKLYRAYLEQPFLHEGKLQDHQNEDVIAKKLYDAISEFMTEPPAPLQPRKAAKVNRKYAVKKFRYSIKDYWRYNIMKKTA